MNLQVSRRGVLAGSGALAISVMLPGIKARAQVWGATTRPALQPDNLSSYISVNADGSVTAFWGKLDLGQGTDVGVAQLIAEELNIPLDKVRLIQSDTSQTINQGGASGSVGIQMSGRALQQAAAEAHLQLLNMASQRLGVPVQELVSDDGFVWVARVPDRRLSYAELIDGRYFDTQLEWNGKLGNMLAVKGKAKLKPPAEHRVIGKPFPRRDISWKVLGEADYVTDVKVPGMLHARVIRPSVAGASLVSFDPKSIADIAGVQVVREKDFLAVVAENEWNAVRAAEALSVVWSNFSPKFPAQERLFDHLRTTKPEKREEGERVGDVENAFKTAARVVEFEYEWPFQSHASLAPACAIVAPQGEKATLWTASQKPHYGAELVANILGLAQENVHGIWMAGPGSYGRNDAGDAVADAAMIAKLTGKIIRVQGSRRDGTAWDPKGPASIHISRAALDGNDNVIAWQFESKGFSRTGVQPRENMPADTLAGHLTGVALAPVPSFGLPMQSYGFPARLLAWETIPPLLDRGSPLRTSHLRDPVGIQMCFACESFMDELAYKVGMDPIALRLKYLSDERDIEIVKAVAEKAGWAPHTAPRKAASGDVRRGQGFAYSQRITRVATVCDVEVNVKTGETWVRKLTVGNDCGMIINPRQVTRTIECSVVQAVSRSLYEEVTFDENTVTSEDWMTYPILDIAKAPEAVDVVLINRRDIEPSGTAEASMSAVPAAIANAIYDATGVRVRRAPFTPDNLRAAGLNA